MLHKDGGQGFQGYNMDRCLVRRAAIARGWKTRLARLMSQGPTAQAGLHPTYVLEVILCIAVVGVGHVEPDISDLSDVR